MSRLADTFAALRAGHRPGLVTYVTAGDPDLTRTEGILQALDRAGADVVEIGVPFSDPLGDGPGAATGYGSPSPDRDTVTDDAPG